LTACAPAWYARAMPHHTYQPDAVLFTAEHYGATIWHVHELPVNDMAWAFIPVKDRIWAQEPIENLTVLAAFLPE